MEYAMRWFLVGYGFVLLGVAGMLVTQRLADLVRRSEPGPPVEPEPEPEAKPVLRGPIARQSPPERPRAWRPPDESVLREYQALDEADLKRRLEMMRRLKEDHSRSETETETKGDPAAATAMHLRRVLHPHTYVLFDRFEATFGVTATPTDAQRGLSAKLTTAHLRVSRILLALQSAGFQPEDLANYLGKTTERGFLSRFNSHKRKTAEGKSLLMVEIIRVTEAEAAAIDHTETGETLALKAERLLVERHSESWRLENRSAGGGGCMSKTRSAGIVYFLTRV